MAREFDYPKGVVTGKDIIRCHPMVWLECGLVLTGFICCRGRFRGVFSL